MIGTMVRLKLWLLAGQFRRSPWQIVGLVLALLYAAGITSGLVLMLVALRYAPLQLATAITVGGGSVVVLGFLVVPVFIGVDDTLDPRRFALLGMDRTALAVGLVVAGIVGVPGLVLVLVSSATIATWSRSPGAALLALLGVPVAVLTCTLLSRIGATTAGLLLATRRSREALAATFVLAIVLIGPVVVVLLHIDLGRQALGQASRVVAVLGWTPLGAVWAAPASVAAGSPAGVLQMLVAVATLLLLVVVWRALLARSLETPGRHAKPQTVAGIGWFGRLPATPFGAVAARATTYWARDVRYRVSILSIPLTPAVLVLVLGFAGVPPGALALIPVPVVGLFLGWASHNDIAYDHTAVWLHVAAGVRGRDDRLGRLAPVLVVGVPLLIAGSVVSAVLIGRPLLAAPLVGVSGCLLLSGMGLGGITSALMPYPVPRPGASPFQHPNSTGGLAALTQSLLFLLQLVVSAPAIVLGLVAVQTGGAVWAWTSLGVGLVVGHALLGWGTWVGGRAFDRRGPEILAAALRA